ncbi:MAG: acetylxylan esterase [Candidatus Hydrogenedentes bacterium]|nr:acetylxylan esterase [Candidatus Hydrogenedentota bacterium]
MRRIQALFILLAAPLAFAQPDPIAEVLAQAALPEAEIRAGLESWLLGRLPVLDAPADAAAWETQAAALRKRLREEVYLEGVPEAWMKHTVKVEWTETIESGQGYTIRKLRYEALPGLWIPALLYAPAEGTGRIPAILNVNGHVGKPGKAIGYEQIRCINLAKRGMLALHPEWFSCGELSDEAYGHYNLAFLDAVGVRGVSVLYLALSRALDVLLAEPRADLDRVAMTGLSGGGWQTAVFSALDERVRVIVPVAGHGGMANRITTLRDMGDLEQVPSDLLRVADYSHITALFAPRPALLIYNAKDDCCFEAGTTLPTVYDPVLPIYRVFNAEKQFQFHINEDPGTHNYELDNRLQFYRFIEAQFLPESAWQRDEIPSDAEVLSEEALTVGVPEGNATFQSLALAVLTANVRNAPGSVEALRAVLRYPDLTLSDPESRVLQTGDLTGTAWRFSTPWGPVSAMRLGTARADGPAVVLVTDAPLSASVEKIRAALTQHGEVHTIAPHFLGGALPAGDQSFQLAMAVDASGARTLGMQAAEIGAFCVWLRESTGGAAVHVVTEGPISGVAAMVAAAVNKGAFEHLTTSEGLTNLQSNIEEGQDWRKLQPLFAFGLLKDFEVEEIRAMCVANGIAMGTGG